MNKQNLLERIKNFLDMPGVCMGSKCISIIEKCADLPAEKLCEIVAFLRIRVRKLISIANSQEKIQEIKSNKNNIKEFLSKYEIH